MVIPVYNSEKFLSESIESVLNQTYENIEVIAVDDGSTDSSPKILEEYSDEIIIIPQENKGLTTSLNTAIKQINGSWFKWFSPDDVMNPNAIETLIKEAEKLSNNTIVYSNWEIIDKDGKSLRQFFESNYNHLSNFDFNVRLLDSQQINVNTTLIPTLLFAKGCNFRNLKDPVAIDYDFFLRSALVHDSAFYLVSKPLVKYRIHRKQLSHKNINHTLECIEDIKKEVLSKLSPQLRKEYLIALEKYNKKKSVSKKAMKHGLKLVKTLPSWASDNILTFYLNNIRRSR